MENQKFFNQAAMVTYLAFVNMFAPFSTDIYMPALPQMGEYFSTSEFLVSMTLAIFFLIFAMSMVICGPLSDKYGRRPVLISGAIIYTVSSFTCAGAANIYSLLVGRFFQALGAGALVTVATAVIKDCFSGQIMRRILAITQVLGVIAPMVAPIVGGILLTFTDWRGSFYLLTVLGVINLILACMFSETLPKHKRYRGNVLDSMKLIAEVAQKKYFMAVLIMFAILSAPYMAYLSVASFIYIENFGLSAQEFSYYFAVNSAASIAGPVIYLWLKNTLYNARILHLCYLVAIGSGVLVLTAGKITAIMFLLSFLPFTAIGAVARPFAMEVLLLESKEYAGTASSMINFMPTLFGSFGMVLGTMSWGNFVTGLGIIMTGATISSIALWVMIRRGRFGAARTNASDIT